MYDGNFQQTHTNDVFLLSCYLAYHFIISIQSHVKWYVKKIPRTSLRYGSTRTTEVNKYLLFRYTK